jgi:hypothetical protein
MRRDLVIVVVGCLMLVGMSGAQQRGPSNLAEENNGRFQYTESGHQRRCPYLLQSRQTEEEKQSAGRRSMRRWQN